MHDTLVLKQELAMSKKNIDFLLVFPQLPLGNLAELPQPIFLTSTLLIEVLWAMPTYQHLPYTIKYKFVFVLVCTKSSQTSGHISIKFGTTDHNLVVSVLQE